MMETATDIYAAVQRMRREVLDALELLPHDDPAEERQRGEAAGLLRVLQMLEDDFGVMRPAPAFTHGRQ